MKGYEENGIKWLISKPRGLFLERRQFLSTTLIMLAVEVHSISILQMVQFQEV